MKLLKIIYKGVLVIVLVTPICALLVLLCLLTWNSSYIIHADNLWEDYKDKEIT